MAGPMPVLQNREIEDFVTSLHYTNLGDICKSTWFERHMIIKKLLIQLTRENISTESHYRRTRTLFVQRNKIKVIVNDIVISDLFCQKIFPIICQEVGPETAFAPESPYLLGKYHSHSCLTLLANVLFQAPQAEKYAMKDCSVDLADYSLRKLKSIRDGDTYYLEPTANVNDGFQLSYCINNEFKCATFCLPLLVHLTAHVDEYYEGLATVFFAYYDLPVIITNLLVENPWFTVDEIGTMWQYRIEQHTEWTVYTIADGYTEVQHHLWNILCNLMLSNSFLKCYVLTPDRQQEFYKLQPYIIPALLTSIPRVAELFVFFQNVPNIKDNRQPPLPPEILTKYFCIISEETGNWENRAKQLIQHVQLYNQTVMKMAHISLQFDFCNRPVPDSGRVRSCGQCKGPALMICKNCKETYYCGKDCEFIHFERHARECNFISYLKTDLIL